MLEHCTHMLEHCTRMLEHCTLMLEHCTHMLELTHLECGILSSSECISFVCMQGPQGIDDGLAVLKVLLKCEFNVSSCICEQRVHSDSVVMFLLSLFSMAG